MTAQGVKRKLTAILSADVKGYSRLMRDDEEGTVRTLTAHREVLAGLIRKHRGRVVDSPGDNVLAEFGSVVDAVQCAVEIQKELKVRNAVLPDNRKMEFRIGINLGDVIKEGKRIYGDGVNIAARVEGLTEGGGVCISGTVYEHVKDKLALGYESLGEHTVKNIPEPVRVYRVLTEPDAAREVTSEKKPGLRRWQWMALPAAAAVLVAAVVIWYFAFRPSYPRVEPASADRMAYPLPDKPSIAVLPFTNMTGDPEQEYFCDGLTEEIITAFSKVENMFVIARNSTFTYKGKAVKVRQVAEEMGVRYVLEGSVRKAEDRVRITGQLIDALTGHHLWAERYDRNLRDVFALHDEITMKILTALQVELTEGEDARLRAKGTDSLEAWGNFVRGVSLFLHFAPEANSEARKLFEEAIRLDPEYATAWTWLSWTYYMDARMGFRESPAESLKRAVEIAQKALALDDTLPEVHSLWNTIYLFQRQHDKPIAEGKKAIALGPNTSKSYALLAETMYYTGGFEEAIALLEKAMRLSPYYPKWYLSTLAKSYTRVGRYEEAIAANKELLERSQKGEPFAMWAHLGLAMTYMMFGRQGEARSHATEALKIDPNWSLEQERKASFYKDPDDLERHLDALREAGIPEKPPLTLPEKPSIAVLPFDNLSEDPEQEYFADGMTDDLITDLSKISGLFVIARNSAFSYKGKAVRVDQISRELGVRYVLEGSVRRAEGRVRINAQLIDCSTGGHLWAERYDGVMEDIFSLQDKVTQKIVSALAVKLTTTEEDQLARKETDSVAAYDAFLEGWAHYVRFTPDDFAKAIDFFKKAIKLDPSYGRAYAALASTYGESYVRLWGESIGLGQDWGPAGDRAATYLRKAMEYPTPLAYQVASRFSTHRRLFDKAFSEAERSIVLDPNAPNSYLAMARVLIYTGRPAEAISFLKKGMRLDPQYPAHYLVILGLAQFGMDQYEEAADSLERALERNPANYLALIPLAAAYAHLDRQEKAETAVAELKESEPFMSSSIVELVFKYQDPNDEKRLLDGLEKAGLPKV